MDHEGYIKAANYWEEMADGSASIDPERLMGDIG